MVAVRAVIINYFSLGRFGVDSGGFKGDSRGIQEDSRGIQGRFNGDSR